MPRYFFHIRQGDHFEEDLEGAEFETPEKAVQEAILAARELLAGKILAGEVIDGQTFEVMDEHRALVDRIPFRTVLKLE